MTVGENEPGGGVIIVGSMESLVEMVQIENSLQNYVNFTPGNGFSWALTTLKPKSFPSMPGATMKMVQIENSSQNNM